MPSWMFDPTLDMLVLAKRCCYCCVLRRTGRLASYVARCLLRVAAAVRSLVQMQMQKRKKESFHVSAHHISWAAARAGPRKRVGRLMGRVDVVIVVASVQHLSWLVAQPGPGKHVDHIMG